MKLKCNWLIGRLYVNHYNWVVWVLEVFTYFDTALLGKWLCHFALETNAL